MHDQRYYELAEKWLNGTITETEKQQFLQWYNESLEDPLSIPVDFVPSEDELKRRIFSRIQKKKRPKVVLLSTTKKYWWAAASIILMLGVSALFYLRTNRQSVVSKNTDVAKGAEQTITPGRDKAVLTLSDGSTIVLDTTRQGLIAQEKNSRVIKLDNGQLAYKSSHDQNAEVAFNVLSTPIGGQYTLVLADGTKVWLNAASSIRFPTVFNGKERIVELKGEAYFEVAKNARMPFRVKVNEMEVNVLGTHFNVMAYDDEAAVKTTLLEGSVRVQEKGTQVTIQPGEQVNSNKQGVLQVKKGVNTEQVVAWKNGLFQFEQTDLASIMRQIARWYDVQIIYEKQVEGHFSGTIAKNANVENVLHMIELTGAVHFTLKGRQIIVNF
ncbi:MAG TPA: FecR domain-containing protein [Chitinophagaceae bacterium]